MSNSFVVNLYSKSVEKEDLATMETYMTDLSCVIKGFFTEDLSNIDKSSGSFDLLIDQDALTELFAWANYGNPTVTVGYRPDLSDSRYIKISFPKGGFE